MPVTVQIPTALKPCADNLDTLSVSGRSVGEVVAELTRTHTGLRIRLCTEEGALREFVNVYINDEDVRYLQGPDTPVRDGDVITIVPAVAGS